MSPYKDL